MMKLRILALTILTTLLTGCPLEGDDGTTGSSGAAGLPGAEGLPGINCWDLNGDRVNDDDEDKNKDGGWDAQDCMVVVVSSSPQSSEVEFNHQHICEALKTLGQYPQGCPSNTHTVPTGTLTRITQLQLFDDGNNGYNTCNNPPNNGLLSIESRVDLNDPSREIGWFVLDGAYIAKTISMSYSDAVDGVCRDTCLGDSNCIAALALERRSAADCSIFYHSDTVSAYERICSLPAPGYTATELCALSLRGQALWDAKCP